MKGRPFQGRLLPKGRIQNLSLRWKVLLVILPLVVVTFVLLTMVLNNMLRNHLIINTEYFLSTLVKQLSFNIARSYEIDNSRSLFQLVKEYVDYDYQIDDIRVIKRDGEITADIDPDKIFSIETEPEVYDVISGGKGVVVLFDQGDTKYYQLIEPIYIWQSQTVNGALVLKYDISRMFATLSKLQTASLLWTLLLVILIAFLITFSLERSITGPLVGLTETISHIDVLQPTVPKLNINSQDEIGTLAKSFTQLLANLQNANSELTKRTAESEQAYQQLKKTQLHLIQSEKMASLGLLTAGIAHEVNNPMNFVSGNLTLIEEQFQQVKQLTQAFAEVKLSAADAKSIEAIKTEIEYERLLEDLDEMIKDCKTGAKRTLEIVQDLRDFSHLETGEIQTININHCLDTTLKLLRPHYKSRIEIKKMYGQLPPYSCYSGMINQVFMNIIINAIQAIENQGTITICSVYSDDKICITISDTGTGIPSNIRHRIFDPFFTTKDIGQGTGLGLSISYRIVQEHRGLIHYDSEPGKGTSIYIDLPLQGVVENGA